MTASLPQQTPIDALGTAVLAALRRDLGVLASFGKPARLYDDETPAAYFPYAVLEQHQTAPLETAEIDTSEHKLTFAVYSRFGGLSEAKELLNTLRAAVDRLTLDVTGQTLVLAHTVYCDAMRKPDQRTFRGIIRIRLIMETTQ